MPYSASPFLSDVSTHSRTKAAAFFRVFPGRYPGVSTHSRTKAAAIALHVKGLKAKCFNTQPHEGGCNGRGSLFASKLYVSTHSRTKAAAIP